MSSKGSGPQKICPKCKEKNHVRKKECSCGYEFQKKESSASKPPKNNSNSSGYLIRDVLLAGEIIQKTKDQGKTLPEFISSIELDWSALEDIKSIDELNELRSLQKFGELLERLGEEALIELVTETQSAKQEI